MRAFVISTFALAAVVALAPSAAFAQQQQQQPPTGQPPAGQAAAGQTPAQPATPPKLAFTTPAGMLLVQIKPGAPAAEPAAAAPAAGEAATPAPTGPPKSYAADFEEMMGKIQSGIASSTDPAVQAYKGAWKYYKASEPAPGGNIMYVVIIDPAKPNTEYSFLEVLNSTLTDAQKRDPATQEMYKRYAAAFAPTGLNKLDITPMGGGQ
ncbi:MAG: hypothetical protein ACRD1V_17285 [Vicinamibacterales bacterium]